MELDKKKYTQKEVSLIFDAYKKEYEKRFSEQRTRINELIKENQQLKSVLSSTSEKEELALAVLKRAEMTAINLEKQSQLEYELELERLKNFSKKWDDFFNGVKDMPTAKTSKKATKLTETVKKIEKKSSPKKVIQDLDKLIESESKINPVFNPKKKIGEYIAATSDGGFNMDEVLNPGELELEDICKELGLID